MAEQAADNQQGFQAYARVLRNRNFFWLWLSQLISMTGDFFNFMAIPFFITLLYTGGETAGATGEVPPEAKAIIGLATLAFTIPRLFGLFTGVFVDRWDRHRTMVIANGAAALVVVIPLLVTGLDMVWLLFVSNFMLALTTRFIQPAQQAALPQLLPEDDLLAANALTSLTQTIAFIVAPVLAGLTLEYLPIKLAFFIDSMTFLVAALIIQVMVRVPPLENAPGGQGFKALLSETWDGLSFLFVTRLLLLTVLCFSVMHGGLGGINAMWIPFMQETFGMGPKGVAIIDMAQGGGMALGGVLLGYLMGRVSKLAMLAGGLIGIGVAFAGMGLSPTFFVVVLFGALLGLALVPTQSGFMTVMQLAIPKELQGRVFSGFFAVTQVAQVLMIAIITSMVAFIPLRAIFVGGGVVMCLAVTLWYFLARDDVLALEARSHVADQATAVVDDPSPAAVG